MRRYFDSSKVRGEGNSVIFINLEILPGPEVSHFSNDEGGISIKFKEVYSVDNDIL